MNLYIYARDLGKKHEKKAIFEAFFFVKKSKYAPKKSVCELLGHTLLSVALNLIGAKISC